MELDDDDDDARKNAACNADEKLFTIDCWLIDNIPII